MIDKKKRNYYLIIKFLIICIGINTVSSMSTEDQNELSTIDQQNT